MPCRENPDMPVFRIALTENERQVVNAERDSHPAAHSGDPVPAQGGLTRSHTVVNTETMCALLRLVAARGLVVPVTLVLDNARYQRNALVMGLAQKPGIELLFLPSYSPNLNLIERLWRFVKRRAGYGKYPPTFADFRAAV